MKSIYKVIEYFSREKRSTSKHQNALELLKIPGMREFMRKRLNLIALKEWEEILGRSL